MIRQERKLITLILLLSLAFVAACEKDGVPSCSDALSHFYSKGCVILIGGDQISLSEAIDGCTDDQADAKQAGCKSEFDNALKCIDGVGQEQCTICNDEIDTYQSCMY